MYRIVYALRGMLMRVRIFRRVAPGGVLVCVFVVVFFVLCVVYMC